MKNAKLVVISLSLLLLPACASHQPHMHEALDRLREARADLEAAEPNKGGHRERAIAACDAAIEETRKGIEFGATH